MTVRDHHVVGQPPNWSRRGNGFQPLTQRDEPVDLRLGPSQRHRNFDAPSKRIVVTGWRSRLFSLRLRIVGFLDPRRWLPSLERWRAWLRIFNRDPRFAAGFAAGEAWLILVMGGAWLLTRFL